MSHNGERKEGGVVEEVSSGEKSELERQVRELTLANRELEAFSQAVSHDLRTSLTRIYSSGQALQEYGESLDPTGLFFVKCINDGCAEVEALLNALMALSRVTEAELVLEPVDLSVIAREKAGELHLAEPQRAVSFLIPSGLSVRGDRRLLSIALENLIRNAWNYTARVPEAKIELGSFTSTEEGRVFFIRDNGAGFDNSRSDQLFKPFKRLHSQQEFPGTGLGLATVHRILRRHNGRIWGESKPGCGATFYFTING